MVIYPASLIETSSPQQQVSEWFTEYHTSLFRYLVRLLGDQEQAADIVQETFIRAMAALSKEDEPPRQPFAWLCRIGSNLAIDHLRRANRWRWLVKHWQSDTPSLEHDVATTDEVRRCLARLNSREAEVLVMTHYLGLSAAEISELTGDEVSAIRVRLHRARQHFRTLYTKENAA